MGKRKILFLIESLEGGGAEKVLATLIQNINKEMFDITVCTISGRGKYENVIKSEVKYKAILNAPKGNNFIEILLYKLKHHLVYNWLPLKTVYTLFVPHDNDIEIAYVEGFATKLLSHSINKKSKKYAWIHIDINKYHWTKNVFLNSEDESTCYNRFHHIYTVSSVANYAFKKEFPNVKTPIGIIHNPIDEKDIKKMAREVSKIPNTEGRIRLVSVGRLVEQKGYDRLIRVVNRLVHEGYNIELWIIGSGPLEEELKTEITNYNLADRIRLWGFQNNPYKFLVQGDVFVCSSHSEGYSTAVTEALILGIPIITTMCSGMDELLRDGEYGIITPNDEDKLYKGLKDLLSTPGKIEHFRQKAIERGQDFSLASLMKPIEDLLLS